MWVHERQGFEHIEVSRVESDQVFDGVRLQYGNQSRIVNTFAMNGQMFHQFQPSREDFR